MTTTTTTSPTTDADKALLALLLTNHVPDWLTVKDLLAIDQNRQTSKNVSAVIAARLKTLLASSTEKVVSLPDCLPDHSPPIQIALAGYMATDNSVTVESITSFIDSHTWSQMTNNTRNAILAALRQKLAATTTTQLVQLWQNQEIGYQVHGAINEVLLERIKTASAAEMIDIQKVVSCRGIYQATTQRLTELWQPETKETLEAKLSSEWPIEQSATAQLLVDKHRLTLNDLLDYVRKTKTCGRHAYYVFTDALEKGLKGEPLSVLVTLLQDENTVNLAAQVIIDKANAGEEVAQSSLLNAFKTKGRNYTPLTVHSERLITQYLITWPTAQLVDMVIAGPEELKPPAIMELKKPHRVKELEALAKKPDLTEK